ncbi:MAG: hypothetical protein RL294_63 [Actinomycetota bacterium]|jgi:hypothetical protein
MNKTPLFAVLALSAIALTGCATASGDGAVSDFAGYDLGAPVAGESANDLGSVAGMSSMRDESIITTAYAFLTGDDPAAVAAEVEKRSTAAQGKIDGRSAYSDNDGKITSVSLTVRIPAAEIDSFLTGLDEIATVHSLSQNSTDVTLTVTDYDARISALESSIVRFTAIQKSATTTQDLIEIESALADRQAQLEQLQSEMRYYSDQIALSTVQVDIGLPDSATDPIPDDFWGGIVAGWYGLLAFFSGTIVAFGMAIPWIPVIAGLAWLGRWLVRRVAARRSTKSVSTKKSTKR